MYFCYIFQILSLSKFEGAKLLFLLKLRYCLKTFQIKYTIYTWDKVFCWYMIM